MKLLQFAWFDHDSIGENIKTRRVIGREPRICKNADNEFSEIYTIPNHSFNGYVPKNKGREISLDNARDIIKRINQLKKDINKYNKLGRTREYTTHVNWRKVALRCEREIDKLNELL